MTFLNDFRQPDHTLYNLKAMGDHVALWISFNPINFSRSELFADYLYYFSDSRK